MEVISTDVQRLFTICTRDDQQRRVRETLHGGYEGNRLPLHRLVEQSSRQGAAHRRARRGYVVPQSDDSTSTGEEPPLRPPSEFHERGCDVNRLPILRTEEQSSRLGALHRRTRRGMIAPDSDDSPPIPVRQAEDDRPRRVDFRRRGRLSPLPANPDSFLSEDDEHQPRATHRRRPRAESIEEVEYGSYGPVRARPRRINAQQLQGGFRQVTKLKFDIPIFDGKMHIGECLDWLKLVEKFFQYMDIPEDKQVKLVTYKLRGSAAAWWEQIQFHRYREGKASISSWVRMKRMIREQFLPVDYDRIHYYHYQPRRQPTYRRGYLEILGDIGKPHSIPMSQPITFSSGTPPNTFIPIQKGGDKFEHKPDKCPKRRAISLEENKEVLLDIHEVAKQDEFDDIELVEENEEVHQPKVPEIYKTVTTIEEMAEMNDKCGGKTGTLTLNKLNIDKCCVEFLFKGVSKEEVTPLRTEYHDANKEVLVGMLADLKVAIARRLQNLENNNLLEVNHSVVSRSWVFLPVSNAVCDAAVKVSLVGMDVNEWNPATDKYISVNFDAETVTEGKAANKEVLQAHVGLPVDKEVPVIVFVGRLEEQKGSDILAEAIPLFIEENVQIKMLGTGKTKMEKAFRWVSRIIEWRSIKHHIDVVSGLSNLSSYRSLLQKVKNIKHHPPDAAATFSSELIGVEFFRSGGVLMQEH